MDDLIKCPKCAEMTNKYYPYCSKCSAPLPQAETKTIQQQGKELSAELEKRSVTTKKCPYCSEEILADAVKCRFCGEFIKGKKGAKVTSAEKKSSMPGVLFGSAALVVLILVMIFGLSGLIGGGTGARYDKSPSVELKKDKTKAEYVKKNITITGIGTLEETDRKGASTKYVTGTVRNAGDKLVIKLVLTVYCFDKNGRSIGEGPIAAVLGTRVKPASIKPGGSTDFKVPMFATTPDWSGMIRAKVYDIELTDN